MKDTEKAFLWITDLLEKNNIQYKISGGFAARAYGVNRELADIDILIPNISIPLVAEQGKEYIIFGPERYLDENWDLELMTLEYEGQEIDISGAEEKLFNQGSKQWEAMLNDLNAVKMIEVYGKKVPVESLESLIAYKTKLAREVDLEDVRQLQKIDFTP